MTRVKRAIIALALSAAVSGCASFPATAPSLVPPPGKQLLIVGQQRASAADQRLWLGPAGGVMTYLRLDRDPDGNPGSPGLEPGLAILQRLAARYPAGALQVGLETFGNLAAIASGELDAKIDRLVETLARTQRPVYLRFGYEFDGSWNHQQPVEYTKAWRHFRERLLASRARNIAMVWHSAAHCGGTFDNHPFQAWYPGDEAVDWIAISWFSPVDCDYATTRALVAFAREHHKPLMIAESTPRGYDLTALRYSPDGRHFEPRSPEQIWNEWYVPYFDFIADNADVVKAVSYINDHWDVIPMWGPPYLHGYWGDARIDVNQEIRERWLAQMRDARWLRGDPDLMRALMKR